MKTLAHLRIRKVSMDGQDIALIECPKELVQAIDYAFKVMGSSVVESAPLKKRGVYNRALLTFDKKVVAFVESSKSGLVGVQ